MSTILIAENDPRTIDLLPRIVCNQIPDVAVDLCTSTEDLARHRQLSSYDAIAISPILLQGYHLLKYKADRHLLTPLLVTASREDRELASRYLERDAFGLIVKPVIPQEAVQTVKLALWQSALLKLLASRERAVARFRQHMEAFPHARQMEEEFASKMSAYDKTLQALTTSLGHLLSNEGERSVLDMAGFVESTMRKQALDRLLTLGQDGTTH